MARLLLDEHLPVRLELALKALGHDLIRARALSTDKAGDSIDDEQLLEQAAIHRRVLVTLDRDFTKLHHEKRHHYGIVVLRRLPKTRGIDTDEATARLLDGFCRSQQRPLNGQLFVMKREGNQEVIAPNAEGPVPETS